MYVSFEMLYESSRLTILVFPSPVSTPHDHSVPEYPPRHHVPCQHPATQPSAVVSEQCSGLEVRIENITKVLLFIHKPLPKFREVYLCTN